MYTIKQASIRTGVSIPLLRAWERRYGIPVPGRTGSGYRLYDDFSIARVRQMRNLVEAGWAPSQAARAILDGSEALPATDTLQIAGPGWAAPGSSAGGGSPADDEIASLVARFLDAARALDESRMESALGDGFALLGVDGALERFVLPALVIVGEAWSRGELTVAAEHAASNAVMRRLGALYEAAATPSSRIDCLIGLPPGARHEVGALAFAVACRRAGLSVLYLGADVPVESWLSTARQHPGAVVALGAVTEAEGVSAAEVVAALRLEIPEIAIAVGGAGGSWAAGIEPGIAVLPRSLRDGAAQLVGGLGPR